MADISVPWGQEELKFSLPEHWTLQQEARPTLKPAVKDWPDRLAEALSQPATGLPLEKLLQARRDGRIAIIIEDCTRHSPISMILPIILREIRHARIDDNNVEVVFATGMHPPMTPQQAVEKLGPDTGAIRWRSNCARDKKASIRLGAINDIDVWVDRGVADADLRIVISSVSPHLQAGFGGGYKMIFPGCAGIEMIRGLHRQGLGRSARQLVGLDIERNPMRAVIDAAGELLDSRHGKTFAVQYLLDHDDLPSFIATGDMIPTQRMMAKQCAVVCGIVPAAPADVLITNAYPRDFDLWQSFKGIANSLWAARPGGVIICLTRCTAGINGMPTISWPLSPLWTRRIVRWLGPEAISSLVTRLAPSLAADAAFFIRIATQVLNRNPIFMVSPVMQEQGIKFPGMEIFGTPQDAMTAAAKLLGSGPQRVTVFTEGGITYPVPCPPSVDKMPTERDQEPEARE